MTGLVALPPLQREAHDERIVEYYEASTVDFYCETWHRRHMHFGLFAGGECPGPDDFLPDHEGLDRAVNRMVDFVVAPAKLRPGMRVVDAGCGVGGTALRLARLHGVRVTGVNLSRPQLQIAAVYAREDGLDSLVEFVHGNCSTALPFPDASVDAVVCIASACHYGDRPTFFSEVCRVLRPGAPLVAMDWVALCPSSDVMYPRFVIPMCEEWALAPLECPDSYRDLLEGVGLEVEFFRDFGGLEGANCTIVDQCITRILGRLGEERARGPDGRWLRMLHSLSVLWRMKLFNLMQYCARRPLSG